MQNETVVYYSRYKRLESLRNSETFHFLVKDEEAGITTTLIVDEYVSAWWQSMLQIVSLVFACLVLFFAYFSGSKDSKVYLTTPFTKLFENINEVIRRPIDYTRNPYYIQLERSKIWVYDDLDEEYATLGNFMFKYCEFLSYALGSKQTNLVVDRLLIKQTDDLTKVKGDVYQAYIVMIKLHEGYSLIKENVDQDLINYIKKSCEIVQRTSDKFNGAT